MRRFVFRLEAALTQRKAVEDQCLAKFAEIQREMNAIQRDLDEIRTAYSETVARPPVGGLDEMSLRERYLDVLALRKAQTERVREGVNMRLREAREKLVAAQRNRKALERVREVQLAEWQAEQLRQEQAFLDELAVIRHSRSAEMRGAA